MLAGESVCARATEARSPVVGSGHPQTKSRFLGQTLGQLIQLGHSVE